jgi:hypothetical protein
MVRRTNAAALRANTEPRAPDLFVSCMSFMAVFRESIDSSLEAPCKRVCAPAHKEAGLFPARYSGGLAKGAGSATLGYSGKPRDAPAVLGTTPFRKQRRYTYQCTQPGIATERPFFDPRSIFSEETPAAAVERLHEPLLALAKQLREQIEAA